MLGQTDTKLNWAFVQVHQVEIDALVEFAVVEGEVELARRVEKHHLIVRVQQQVEVLAWVSATA